ncbi:MAG: EF-P lysine aminoacylase GenX, partial [Xanthomonadales bacterium]|nr:EF-P lysine aminoacylase GenX [Xanthomonadales bacterium]
MSGPGATPSWRPGASRHAVEARAKLLSAIRSFMAERGVLEVETPMLTSAGNSDPNIRSFSTDYADRRYLRTSPEYAMKRLLACGHGHIYELGRVFRADEKGQR